MFVLAYITVMVAMPIAVWISTTGNIIDYIDPDVPRGQLLYVLSKLTGLITLSLLAIQVSLMAFRSRLSFHWKINHHMVVGLFLIGFATLHAVLFFTAASLRSEHIAWALLTLRFNSGFYNIMVSIGLIALCVVWITAVLGRYSLKNRSLILWHRILISVASLAILVHSYAIGSETHSIVVRFFYIILISIMVLSLLSISRSAFRWSGRHG